MKGLHCFLLIILLFLIACNTTSVKNSGVLSEAETQIAEDLIQQSFDDLWAGFDSTKILQYHTPDFYILENGEVWDNQRIKEFMREASKNENPATRTNRMEFINMEKRGEAINMAYHNYATFTRNDSLVGKGQWLESALAIPTEEGWRLRMMHSTWVPQREE